MVILVRENVYAAENEYNFFPKKRNWEKKLLVIFWKMEIVALPRYGLFWPTDFLLRGIADVMSKNDF